MSKRPWLIGGGIVVLAVGWALFRPELLFIDKTVNESFPVGGTASANAATISNASTPLASGQFHGVAHETKGTATIYRVADGKRVLRLANFETSNGPDVRVLLVAASDATDNDAVKNGQPIELGKLKGNVGDQNYDVPDSVDLVKYSAVTIWCNRFSVNFGTAPLAMAGAGSDAADTAASTVLRTGEFHAGAHVTRGTATVYEFPNGRRVLRLTNFETSNGPDVRVLMIAAADAEDSDTVKNAKPIELGKLKGNLGDQNYDVPAAVDLDKYRAVTIWCQRFGVNFGTAPLQ